MKNFIFDWSGTLSNDFDSVYETTMLVMDKLIKKTITKEEYRREFKLPYMDFWNKYISGLDVEDCDRLYLEEAKKVSDPVIYPNVREIITRLFNDKNNLIVVSSVPQPKLDVEARSYALDRYFKEINGSVRDKVKSIDGIVRRNKFDVNKTFYVGDMQHDIDAGKKAGVKTVAITWGYQNRQRLSQKNPDYIIDNILELESVING